jgi:tripartite-type tricarboxylate transporter receptor subunit TctC
MKRLCIGLLAGLLSANAAATAAWAQGVSFQDKAVTMIVGFPPAGGTDVYGRLVAGFLGKQLPGAPNIVVRNMPGADGVTSMNYMVQQVAPDGLTVMMTANTTADPLNYRKTQATYDPTHFVAIGGAARGGEAILIAKDAEKRLYDKSAAPVIMGSPGGIPRSGMQMTAWGIEYLNWNAKWVIGYRGTADLMLALERGEVEMTATANLFAIQKMLDTGKFKILVQSGSVKDGATVPRVEFGDAPTLAKLLDGKVKDQTAFKALEYWAYITTLDKWMALPPKTPQPIVDVYRTAYAKMIQDPDFIDRGKKISDDVVPSLHGDVETLIVKLGSLPPEATEFMTMLLRKQGLEVK